MVFICFLLPYPTRASPIYAIVFLSKSDVLNFAVKTEVVLMHSVVQATFYLMTYLTSCGKCLEERKGTIVTNTLDWRSGHFGLTLGKSFYPLNLSFLSDERAELTPFESSPDSQDLGF